MTVWLLDANVLIALTTESHVHHERASRWYSKHVERFATCPLTQSALLRFQLRFGKGATPNSAWTLLRELTSVPEHEFWKDEIDFHSVRHERLTGHQQVNDAYLAALARHYTGRISTLDVGFAKVHSDVASLISD